jgi:hypothetical protein
MKQHVGQSVAFIINIGMLFIGIDVDIEVRSKNKDDKTSTAQKECNQRDGKNSSEEENNNAMEVDDKHDKEANAARSERESPEAEGWTVVNEATQHQGMNLIFLLAPVVCGSG